MWKEFRLEGKRLETRLIHRFGPGEKDFFFAAYRWNDDESDAVYDAVGGDDVRGTEHDIPNEPSCRRCHGLHAAKGGLPSRFLGFSLVQLSHAGQGLNVSALVASGALSNPPAAPVSVPGSDVERAALGYLHANCGNCHNGSSDGLIYPFFDVRLRAADATLAMTGAYTTVVNVPPDLFQGYGCNYRVAGGDLEESCFHLRMNERGDDLVMNTKQMPPIASDVVDPSGLGILDAWIATLPPPPM